MRLLVIDTNDRFADVDSSDCVIPRLLTVSISPFRLMMISSGRHFPRNRVTVEGCSKRENPEESPNFRGEIRLLVPLGLQKTPAVSAEQNWERRRLSASWAVRPKFPRFAVFVREREALVGHGPGKHVPLVPERSNHRPTNPKLESGRMSAMQEDSGRE